MMGADMRVGVLTFVTDEGIGAAELAVAVEERGFESLVLAEHTHIPVRNASPYPGGGPIPRKYHRTLDPFVALATAAGVTERLVLGTGVALVPQRDPIITAKEVASLDLLSAGRFIFGVGVGWNRQEVANHGVDAGVRGRVTDERLDAMIAIWTQDEAEFHGDFVDFDPIYCWPKPVTKPYPPLYIGGGGPAAFQRIARLNAGWMAIAPSPRSLARDLEDLRSATVHEVPVTVSQFGIPERQTVDGYRALGVERFLVELPTEPRDDTLRRLDDLTTLI
jgi:probable F420-dependent oxidoreductase